MGDRHHLPDPTELNEETLAVLDSDMRPEVKLRLVEKLWHGRRLTAAERRQQMRGIALPPEPSVGVRLDNPDVDVGLVGL